MRPEVDELRPKLKEILYDCTVEIGATKAALYVLDLASNKFELVVDYGFKTGIRQSTGHNDAMVDRCSRGRSPFYVNNPAAEPRLSELLFDSSTSRLMGVPLFSRGQLIGFIDMRDKSRQQPFDQFDVGKAQSIADRMLALFATQNIWNQRFITLSDQLVPEARIKRQAPVAPIVPLVPKPSSVHNDAVTRARAATAHLLSDAPPPAIGLTELEGVNEALRAILLLPGVVAAMFSATGAGAGYQQIVARGTLSQDAMTALELKLQTWLNKRGESFAVMTTTVHYPFGQTNGPVIPADLQKVFTAAVVAGGFAGLYLTVAFNTTPDRATHELLAAMLNQLQSAIDAAITNVTLKSIRWRIAEQLIEPDATKFPDLVEHSAKVAHLADEFAQFLNLTPAEIEIVRLTALVHDCGMRHLDYDRLYRKEKLTQEELDLMREHVSVGAAMVEPFFGPEVARAVLSHHERVDGGGYPNQLKGEQIPLASRVIQICDVFLAMTEPSPYQASLTLADALAAIRRGAGGQFDEQFAVRFHEMMSARAAKLAIQ